MASFASEASFRWKRGLAVNSRRKFVAQAGVLAAGTMGALALPADEKISDLSAPDTVSLCDEWSFRTDSGNVGKAQRWFGRDESISAWHEVLAPHTCQHDPA